MGRKEQGNRKLKRAAMSLSQEKGKMIRKMRKQDLAMINSYYDMVIDIKEAVEILAQLHTKKLELNLCVSSRFVTLRFKDYIVLEILCVSS